MCCPPHLRLSLCPEGGRPAPESAWCLGVSVWRLWCIRVLGGDPGFGAGVVKAQVPLDTPPLPLEPLRPRLPRDTETEAWVEQVPEGGSPHRLSPSRDASQGSQCGLMLIRAWARPAVGL